MARIVAPALAEGLGQPVVVENRPGAGTLIAGELVAKSAADGYTLLIAYPSFVIAPALYGVSRFDPLKDFTPVAQTMAMSMGMAVHPSLPVKSVRELVALARAKPGEIAYGAGAGTGHYLIGELFRRSANIDITPVPYQGSNQLYPAFLGGHISMIVSNVVEMAPFVVVGKLRPLAVTPSLRDEAWPTVPTMREAGFPELEAAAWGGIVVRASTPQSVVNRLNGELVRAVQTPTVAAKLKSQSMKPTPSTSEHFAALIQSDSIRYARVIREAGVKVQ